MKVYVVHWYDTEEGNYFVSIYSTEKLAIRKMQQLGRLTSTKWTLRYDEVVLDAGREVKIPTVI